MYAQVLLASTKYQVDLILFTHIQNGAHPIEASDPLLPMDNKALPLKDAKTHSNALYTLLPPSQSSLRNEYYLLSRKSSYQILGRYTWKQENNTKNLIAFPSINQRGWLIQGTMHLEQGSYYTFNTTLQCSPPSHPSQAFTVIHKKRIKENTVYYLDHPIIGMLIKVHKI